MTPIDDAAALIRRSHRIALATHVSPDPDAIGSLLGLGISLQSIGKLVSMLCDSEVPDNVTFLDRANEISSELSREFNPDLFIGVDASDTQRLGNVSKPLLAHSIPVLNVDHHITNLSFGDVNVVITDAASCAEVVVALLDTLTIPIEAANATCLMAGMVGDTRGFSTPSVTPETLQIAARLLEAGADLPKISERILNLHTLDGLRLWGMALGTIRVVDSIVWVSISLDDRKAANIVDADGSGLSNLLLTIPEARISAVFTEQEDGQIEISMRARPGFDVATVALSLGGGGHSAAAGCTVSGPIESAVEQVIALFKSAQGHTER